jgi:hypothetical protein
MANYRIRQLSRSQRHGNIHALAMTSGRHVKHPLIIHRTEIAYLEGSHPPSIVAYSHDVVGIAVLSVPEKGALSRSDFWARELDFHPSYLRSYRRYGCAQSERISTSARKHRANGDIGVADRISRKCISM